MNTWESQQVNRTPAAFAAGVLLLKAVHIRCNSRQVNHSRKVRAGRRGHSEHKKCENELASGEEKAERETVVVRNCQNELPHALLDAFRSMGDHSSG